MIDIGADLQRAFDEGYEKGKADRPQGEWKFSSTFTDSVESEFATVKCSRCGYEAFAIARFVTDGNYCPNCGARMKGADDE